MNSKIKLAFGVVVFALSCSRPAFSQERTVALLKDTKEAPSMILVGKPGAALILITSDQRPKSELRWVPGGQRLSYRVRDENGALTRLVIIDLSGKITKEIPIEPVTDPPSERPRFIADIIWQTESKFRVIGSITNWNCETYDMDWQTGEGSNGQFGQCGDFVSSPDGKHTAYLSQTSGGRDEERYQGVQIDGGGEESAQGTPGPILYQGPDKSVFRVISHLVWSEDSKRLAFLKKTVESGQVTRSVPVPGWDQL